MSIEIKDLNFTYGQGTPFQKHALRDITVTIHTGEFVGLIGHTGSGKSTLIQQFNRLLKPDSGLIIVDGININQEKVDIKKIRQNVGLVFQYPEHQLFEMTVYKDVAFGPTNMGLSQDDIQERVKRAILKVGLTEEIYEKSPFELSGGQKRRVAIAGVLAMEPQILILDEPTAGLDPKGRDEILNEITRIHKETKITIILVSHSMEDIAKHVERILVMDEGLLKLDGTAEEVFRHIKELEDMGLAVPQVTYLIEALKEKGFDFKRDAIHLEQAHQMIKEILMKRME